MSSTFSWTIPPALSAGIDTLEEQEAALLGKDIMFNGDYRVTAAGDYVLLSGLEALRQAIYRRLLTRPGEFRVRPDYGVGIMDFVKKRRVQTTLDILQQRVVDQLSFDTRIAEVVAVTALVIEDGLQVNITVKAAGRTLQFEPFNFTERPLVGTLPRTTGLRIG